MRIPRIVIGGSSSGSGKTTVTCGLLQALRDRGMKVRAFKCGPDYIDPMFHSRILGIPSGNVDLFLNDADTVRHLFCRSLEEGADIAVVEGVMGYYDGVAGRTSQASAWDAAGALDAPALLVVDAKGRSVSMAAEIKGFLEFRKDSRIEGVVLNRMPPSIYGEVKELIEAETGVPVCGFMPVIEEAALESRHLGLVTAGEVEDLREKMEILGRAAGEHMDLDLICRIAGGSGPLSAREPEEVRRMRTAAEERGGKVSLGIARDKAFCFYYEDNLRLLEDLGAELVRFSPLAGDRLPEGLSGLILGGGYPELHLEELSGNKALMEDIRRAAASGMPCLAECGGFMYLHEQIEDGSGRICPGAGVIEGRCFPAGRLTRFGYIDMEMKEDTLLGRRGTRFRGHEFHYWDSDSPGDSVHASKPLRKRSWDCVHGGPSMFCGYPHIHLYSNPRLAESFMDRCREYDRK